MGQSISYPASKIPAQCWTGTNFPAQSLWTDYETLFQVSHNAMLFGGDLTSEIAGIHDAVTTVAQGAGVDNRFVLAILMRESSGVTTTPCGDAGKSCGLMQVQGPNVPSCYSHPCANATITQMIDCGTVGCAPPYEGGANLHDCLTRYGGSYGAAARCYNSGSVADPADWTKGAGNPSYVQDIANILLGYDAVVWVPMDKQCGF